MGARELFDISSLVPEAIHAFLRPPQRMSCAEWADTYRRIVKGPERGQWHTDRTPYLREPMECTDPEHPAHKVVMQFATQLGKSEVLYNALFKRIHLEPVDMMMVQPTLNDAKDHSRQRFTPTLKEMPEIFKLLPPPRSREEQNTWQTKEVRGGATLFFAGANSARSLASKPLGFVECDEIDGYPLDVDGEGDPLSLVWERMSNFPTRKLLLCSTPTTTGISRIEAEYLASDRRRYHVPCPHCAGLQVLVWGDDSEHGIKWLKTASGEPRPETAVYVCEHCGAAIEEQAKTLMLQDGRWIAEQPGAQRGLVAGFHLSKLYSPLGWKSWAMLVDDWTRAREAARNGDSSQLKTFTNTSLAKTWEEQGDRASEHELFRRAHREQEQPLGVVRDDMYVRTLGVDVQNDRLEAYDWAWGRGLERQLVDRRVIYGDPGIPESEPGSPWAELTQYRRSEVLNGAEQPIPLLATFVDSGGHNTQAVYVYCRAHQLEHVCATKGLSVSNRPIVGKPSTVDVTWRGVKAKRGAKLWPLGVDTAKGAIYSALRIQTPGPGYVHLTKALPSDVFEQITAERMVTRYVKGRARLEWVKPAGRRNEALDCAVLALAAAVYVGIDRWNEPEWARREKQSRPVEPVPVVPGFPSVLKVQPQIPSSPGGPLISLSGMSRFRRG